MIQVVYDRKRFRVTMEGHAQSGEPGKDLVCAGASALAYTLAANVGEMVRRGMLRKAHAELKSGRAEVFCLPKGKFAGEVRQALEAVCLGFGLLAEQYPGFVSYRAEG